MTEDELQSCSLGLYRVFWANDGGYSLAAIGMDSKGRRWVAPTNWVSPALATTEGWSAIARLERIELENERESD